MTVAAGGARLEAYLFSYHQYLGDARVSLAEHVVVRAGREEKIVWFSTRWGGSRVSVSGRRLDEPGAFTQRFSATPGRGFYPSGLRVPTAGCWELTLRTPAWMQRVVVEAIEPASAATCDATPLRENGWLSVVPRRSGITAGFPIRSDEGALLYAGGRAPDGPNMKVLWRAEHPGGLLVLRGIQLGGHLTFRQTFTQAVSPTGYWPSTVVVPAPGCWLLVVRGIGRAAGIVVVRVVSP